MQNRVHTWHIPKIENMCQPINFYFSYLYSFIYVSMCWATTYTIFLAVEWSNMFESRCSYKTINWVTKGPVQPAEKAKTETITVSVRYTHSGDPPPPPPGQAVITLWQVHTFLPSLFRFVASSQSLFIKNFPPSLRTMYKVGNSAPGFPDFIVLPSV